MKKTDIKTEQLILEAAKKVFIRKGMDGARMQEIADEAQINKALLHYYYRSKQQLFEAVFIHAFTALAPQLNAILNQESSIECKVREFTKSYTSFMIKQPYLPGFIIQELNRNPDFVQQIGAFGQFPNLDKFRLQLNMEIDQGKIQSINPEQLFVNIMALNIFPFLGKPLIKGITAMDDNSYHQMVEERKELVADFIIQAIKVH